VEPARNKCRRHEFKRMCKGQEMGRHNTENDGNLNRQTSLHDRVWSRPVYGLSEELPRIRTSYRKKTGNQCFSKNPNDASFPADVRKQCNASLRWRQMCQRLKALSPDENNAQARDKIVTLPFFFPALNNLASFRGGKAIPFLI
jgi:hypothetical protein